MFSGGKEINHRLEMDYSNDLLDIGNNRNKDNSTLYTNMSVVFKLVYATSATSLFNDFPLQHQFSVTFLFKHSFQ